MLLVHEKGVGRLCFPLDSLWHQAGQVSLRGRYMLMFFGICLVRVIRFGLFCFGCFVLGSLLLLGSVVGFFLGCLCRGVLLFGKCLF